MFHHRCHLSRLWLCYYYLLLNDGLSSSSAADRRGEAFAAAATTFSIIDQRNGKKKEAKIITSSSFDDPPAFAAVLERDVCLQATSSSSEPEILDKDRDDLVKGRPTPPEPEKRRGSRIWSSSLRVEEYHLLWSPGSWKKFVIGTSSLFLAHAVGKLFILADLINGALSSSSASVRTPHHGLAPVLLTSLATNFVIPMLASACCSLQLVMNVFAVGCAGFNTVLGPVRPYFISLLFYLTLISSRNSNHDATKKYQWAIFTTLRWAFALLPEGLHLWNNRHGLFAGRHGNACSNDNESSLAPSTSTTNGRKHVVADVHLDIPTMGCVACINSIDRALRKTDGVQFVTASLNPFGEKKGGQAEVRIAADSREKVDAIVQTLTVAVESAGFSDSSVKSIHVKKQVPKP